MRLWQDQRNRSNSQNKGITRRAAWREALVVALLLIGAAAANWAQPHNPNLGGDSRQLQRADLIDDLIDIIDKILGGGSGSGGGSGGGGGGTSTQP